MHWLELKRYFKINHVGNETNNYFINATIGIKHYKNIYCNDVSVLLSINAVQSCSTCFDRRIR